VSSVEPAETEAEQRVTKAITIIPSSPDQGVFTSLVSMPNPSGHNAAPFY
jgi:hypothetical protein